MSRTLLLALSAVLVAREALGADNPLKIKCEKMANGKWGFTVVNAKNSTCKDGDSDPKFSSQLLEANRCMGGAMYSCAPLAPPPHPPPCPARRGALPLLRRHARSCARAAHSSRAACTRRPQLAHTHARTAGGRRPAIRPWRVGAAFGRGRPGRGHQPGPRSLGAGHQEPDGRDPELVHARVCGRLLHLRSQGRHMVGKWSLGSEFRKMDPDESI